MTAAHQTGCPVAGGSVERWKRGHQVFHLYLVAMNTVLEDGEAALEAADLAALTASLRDLARLYDAATACMRYAADFSAEDYEHVVRPTMMPPHLNSGFSGLLNRDHAAMLARVRLLRPRMAAIAASQADGAEAVTAAWDAVRAAQRRNRAHHMLVCRRFVSDGVSLLREFYANQRASTEEEPRS